MEPVWNRIVRPRYEPINGGYGRFFNSSTKTLNSPDFPRQFTNQNVFFC